MRKPVISAKGLYKTFTQFADRPNTLKSFLVNVSKGLFRSKDKMTFNVLDGVNFDIYPGEIVGIMGRNGAGKSTLIRLIGGIYSPDKGKLEVKEKVATLVGLGAGFHPELTGYENIFLNGAIIGFGRNQIMSVVDKIIEFSELGEHIHAPVKTYSSGMVLRLGFSVAAHIDAPILLLDEILGVGDEGFYKKSLTRLIELIKSGRTIVLITHDPESVLKFCTRCLILENGVISFDGNPAEGINRYSALFAKSAPAGQGSLHSEVPAPQSV